MKKMILMLDKDNEKKKLSLNWNVFAHCLGSRGLRNFLAYMIW